MIDSPVKFTGVTFQWDDAEAPLFKNLSISLSPGVTSLLGQNGTGKSTFLLLASGRLKPLSGTVNLLGQDTQPLDEQSLNQSAAFVYQNMEFETDESLENLLSYVFENGYHEVKSQGFLDEVTKTFELESLLSRKTQNLSKGEMQRAVMAFAILYGSKTVMMDEPVFALEEKQKHKAMEYISAHSRSTGRTFLYSVHEMDLSRRYSDNLLLFHKDHNLETGKTADLFNEEKIQKVYGVPLTMLHQAEKVFRDSLK